MKPGSRLCLAAVVALCLTGCAGLSTLSQVTKSTALYDLTPKSTYDPDLSAIQAQLVVEEPTAAGAVNTDRIAVRPNPYEVAYFPEVRWVDRTPLLVQTMLVESFENTGKVTAVGRQAIGLNSDFTLVTDLREFQAVIEGAEDGPFTVVVHLNMKIVQEPRGVIVASQPFVQKIPAASDDMNHVVAAFDRALGKAMGDAVEWSVRQIAVIGG